MSVLPQIVQSRSVAHQLGTKEATHALEESVIVLWRLLHLCALLLLFSPLSELLWQLHARIACQLFDRLKERQILVFDQKINGITIRITAKAFKVLVICQHVKRWRLFLMKRAATAVLVTRGFEIAIHADQLHEIYPRQQLLQKFLGYIRHGSDSLRLNPCAYMTKVSLSMIAQRD